jgi:hypothetical protein
MFSCSHGNISFLQNEKEGRKQKVRVDNIWGGFVLVHSLEFWEHPWAHALECPSLRRMHSNGNLPYNLNPVEVCQMVTLGVL